MLMFRKKEKKLHDFTIEMGTVTINNNKAPRFMDFSLRKYGRKIKGQEEEYYNIVVGTPLHSVVDRKA